jgi:hypothetical protein
MRISGRNAAWKLVDTLYRILYRVPRCDPKQRVMLGKSPAFHPTSNNQ